LKSENTFPLLFTKSIKMRCISSLLFLCLLTACQLPRKSVEAVISKDDQQPVLTISFQTPDSITIIGDVYKVDEKAITILLFHQAGANARGEYHTIIPRLLEAGYNVFAFDQRVGGQRFGSFNRTMTAIENNRYGYCDAYPDLNSALDYVIAQGYTGKKIIWGSSYSAALVIQLANKRPEDVTAVLAFSPASGGALENCLPNPFVEGLKVPLLALRPASEMEYEDVKVQLEMIKSFRHETFVSENGVHGSSMLVEERTGSDVSKTWEIVMAFLARFKTI